MSDFRDEMPTVYECNCEVVVEGQTWWMVSPRCPEHDKPVRPHELEPIPEMPDGGWECDFWVL